MNDCQKNNNPKVSIITVCYNSSKTIKDSIDSILSQTYPNIEYIIIDGNSTDGTQDIVESYGSKISKFVSEPDKGLYDAMNKGLALATGEIIGTLNSDDFYFSNDSVFHLIKKMTESNSDSVFADLIFIDPENSNKVTRYYKSGPWTPGQFRFGKMPAHPTFFVKNSCYKEYGLFSTNYKIAADYELLVRLLYKGRISYSYLPEPVVKMRVGGISTTGIKSSIKLNLEIVKACKQNGLWTFIGFVLLKIPFKLTEVIKYKLKNQIEH